jgi:Helix-hairpin-helix domain
MPSHGSSGASATEHIDDLTRISGIGSAVARKLQAAGIHTYRDVETSTPDELAAAIAVPACTPGRIEAMDWIGQARRLGSISAAVDVPPAPADPVTDEPPPILEVVRLGTARVRPLHRVVGADQSIAVALELRRGPAPPPAPTLDYSAEITARRLDGEGDVPVAHMTGTVRAEHGISHAAAGPSLTAGLYRLAATITLYPGGHDPDDTPVGSLVAQGDLVQVGASTTGSRPEPERTSRRRPASRRLLAEGVISEDEYAQLTAGPPS